MRAGSSTLDTARRRSFCPGSGSVQPHGIDRISEDIRSQWEARGLRLLHRDLEADPTLPYPDGYFSTVTRLAVFEHVPMDSLMSLLLEVRRVLEPGGVFVMTTPAGWTGPAGPRWPGWNWSATMRSTSTRVSTCSPRSGTILATAGFDPALVHLGHFEVGMNNWGVAQRGAAPTV